MEKELETYLEYLNSERCLKKPKESIIILNKITKCLAQETSQFTMGLLISLLLNEKNALLTFIRKMSVEYENVPAVTAAFKLLKHLVTDLKKSTEPYYPYLFQKSLIFFNAKFAKVKEESLRLIRDIIAADSRQPLDLPKLESALEKYLREEAKIPGSVLEQIYGLLGYLFEKNPEIITQEKWFLKKMFETLQQEGSAGKNASSSAVKGAFEGVNGYFMNYSPLDKQFMKKIYEYIKPWSKFREDKKAASRAALKILQNHWSRFSKFMYDDREFWKINMQVWIQQKKEDREVGFKFLCAFYSVIALFIKQESNGEDVRSCLNEFTETLNSGGNSHEKKAALVGIKLFVLTGCLTGKDFNMTYELVVSFVKEQEARKFVSCLPHIVECMSAFVSKSPNESQTEELALLQKLSVKLIDVYPDHDSEFQTLAVVALEKSFYMLGLSNLQIMEIHIEKVLYQGLIRTCSLMTFSELELLKETEHTVDSICYKSYLGLWKHLLTLSSSPNLPVGGSFNLKKGVAVKVFDVFMSSFIKILSKLNFNVNEGMEVENPSDLHIFINIVDLYDDLMQLVDPFCLQKWLFEILKTSIHLSYANPLVSGLYKIAKASLKMADSIEFFDDHSDGQKKKCVELVRTFLEDVLVKIDQFKGDLQLECLKVVLAVPVNLIEDFVENTIPALEVIIQLARSSPALLNDLVEALERWDSRLSSSNRIMEKILPHFNVFFQSPYFRGNNSVDWSKAGKKVKNQVIFNDSEYLTLQKNFLMFLGNMEMRKALNMIELPETEVRGIEDKPLTFFLPCGSRSVELNLEEIILRVVNLAGSCGDKNTRISACELLYSLLMVILGNVNQATGTYRFLFRTVFTCCLNLGCDSDGVVCQIFEPLMYQVMRYFSGKKALHFSETNDLIDILIDRVTCPFNPTVRDFAGVLLREFTEWSIKQLTPEELKVTPESIKRILEKIYSLALHPSYNKRLGAAVLFNKIYPILREEDFILNAYWFELFYYFMESLRMCDGPEDVTEITDAIRHLERPLVEYCDEFNKECPHRVVPLDFKGGRLCHLVRWTMERASDTKPATRHTAMRLVENLAPLVENCDSNMSFASKQLHNFFQLKENSFESNFGEEEFITWLKSQNAGFEYCTWLVNQKVLTTEEVFQPKFKAALKRFINEILSQRKTTAATDGFKRLCILSFFDLLYTLKERAILFPPEHWNLLKKIVFNSSMFGFDLYRASTTDQLSKRLIALISYFSQHLPSYEWNNFYTNLEIAIFAPVFSHITRNRTLSLKNLEFLFGIRVVESSGIWNCFAEKVFLTFQENSVFPIFRALFHENGKTVHAVALDPSCKLYLEEILEIILKVSSDLTGVMRCLQNEEEVQEEETGKIIKKGEYFQVVFKNTIFRFLECKFNLFLDWVLTRQDLKSVKFLLSVLEFSGNFEFNTDLFARWEEIKSLNLPDATLLQLVNAGAKLGTPGFLKYSPIADKIYEILENSNFYEMDLAEIELAFSLLPYFSPFGEDVGENDKLSAYLSKVDVGIDTFSRLKDTFSTSRIHSVLRGFLHSLNTTASLIILKFILERAAWFNSVCQKEDFESALSVFGSDRVPLDHVNKALELVHKFCFENEKEDLLPSVIYKLFLSPLMRVAPSLAVRHLVEGKMESLCDLITTYWGDGKSSIEILINMTRKICAAGVFQTFITKVPKEEVDEMPKEKRQLMVGMIRKVFLLLKRPYPPVQVKERYRKLMCEIFNMICCVVSARCMEEKFYKLFVFDERGSFLFETIDKTLKYNFAMDFDEVPKRKKHLTILRETVSEAGKQKNFEQDSVKYIQTNTLFTSSLREDVTRFDLTFSSIRPMNSVVETMTNVEIELEMDSLNCHECMATLVATILKLTRDKIAPVDDAAELPCWLKFFLSILKNSELCENLKLFVLKAIYNVQEFITPFYEKIFPDLLDAILKLFVNYPINYFLFDLIEMIVEWKYVPREDRSRFVLTEVVQLILSKSDSLRRDVIQSNLEIIKTMIEVWKDGLQLEMLSAFVYSRLRKSLKEDSRSTLNFDSVTYLNLHLCSVLLSNGIPTWEERERPFFSAIVNSLREENRNNKLTAEICGLALKHLEKTNSKKLKDMEKLVQNKISSLEHSWLTVLYGVHKHYPRISEPFTFRIFSSTWDSNDSLTVNKLEMLLSHVSESEVEMDATFDRHAGAFILDMLDSPDVAVQEISLQIAEKLLDRLDNDKLKVFMVEAVRLQKSAYSEVRKRVYEICKKLHTANGSPDVVKHCKVILLRGLKDGVEELEKSCLEFWQGILNFTSPPGALLQILQELYAPDTEEIFLSNASRVLIQFADNFRYKKNLFPHPITPGCKFYKRHLVLGSRQSFLLSLASSGRTLTNHSLEQVATVQQRNVPYQRPTINSLKFQPTVLENSEEEALPTAAPQITYVPKNPFKRRQCKNESKTHYWRKKKEEVTKKQAEVKIYGEYRNGDYPDIQIPRSQILKLLEVLSKKDHQIARFFLISFYSGVFKSLAVHEKNDFLSETQKLFENILKTSASFDPGVFGFLLRVIFNHNLNVDCQLISNAAVSSNWVSLGALIIEQIIADKEGGSEGVPEKRSNRESPEEKRWLELARLYRNLEEFDALSGVFLDKLKVVGDAREAIRCETVYNWQGASKHYEEVLRTKAESSEREFYTESYLSCLAKLSNWSSLNKCIRKTVNNDLNELWNNYNLLFWFLKSEMMISLGTDGNEFRSILERFCEKNVRENILCTNFGEEMTVFDWFSNNIQRANYRIDKLSLDFLAEWSHLDQWSYNLRVAKLSKLQVIAELSFALKNLSEVSKSRLEQNIKAGVKRWETNLPLPRDDLTIWDVKLTYRREFLKHLKDFDLRGVAAKCHLSLAKVALAQENLHMAKECLSKAKDQLPEGDFDLKTEHDVCFNLGKIILARTKMKNRDVGWEVYLNVWNGISKQIASAMETDSNFYTFAYSCNFTLGMLVSEILPYLKKEPVPPNALNLLCSKLKSSEDDIANAVERKGLEYFEAARRLVEKKETCSVDMKSNTYLELAKFFLKFPNSGSFQKLTKYLLKSMALGNQEARELFGCVLNVPLPGEHSFDDVISESDSVPSWMFITWINQMLACLNSNLSPILKAILIRLTQDYPNAVRYALKLRRELKTDEMTSFFLEKLHCVSADKIYDDFCTSMRYLAPPNLILSHHLESVLQKASHPDPDLSQIRADVLYLKDLMFSPEYCKFRGPVFKFWEKFEQPIEELLIGLPDVELLKRELRNLLSSIESSKMPSKRVLALLESYSPWLYDFHTLKFDTELEIPGQYDGTREPIKKYLVTTSSFRNAVLLFDSKCRPMRMSILGNDAKEHRFLVKFGEDLRQDERIQHVFQHFNHRLKESSRSRFCIDTYKVVPITLSLGMIEWVENTVSLYEMVESSLGNDSDAIAKAQNAHLSFLSQGTPLDTVASHLVAFENITREAAVLNFKIRVQEFPRDLLKKSFLSLSTSPEHFIHLRGNFATSHAIMSVTHWLVGIGDRHLQNNLISTKTGRVLGIDFGYAFGFATHFLTPPELIPFRLTPQILNLMHPLEESGWIKETMIHTLRIYRKESFRLQSVLEVFAKEPVMDWLKRVRKNTQNTWHPRKELQLVERKLCGANPVAIFEADLRGGHHESKHLSKYLEVVRGSPRYNIRARYAEEGLSEEEQVECLIDLASDPHVLAKTYIGWNPWL